VIGEEVKLMSEDEFAARSIIKVFLIGTESEAKQQIEVAFANQERFQLVGWSATGNEGIKQISALKPDLVLIDVNIQDMDAGGIETH
jgi:chemotaxis response regulator CheB